jgi:outer membrane protein assembly factor BamC
VIPARHLKEASVNPNVRRAALAAPLLALLALGGCSILESDKIDYKSATRANTLEVPPDLTQLSRDSRYRVDGPVTASAYQGARPAAAGTQVATLSMGDVRMERSGTQRWLVVNQPADKVWSTLRDFWQDSGFLLVTDQSDLGIMETDWAENRAKLPQDFIRATLGRVLDSLYSTGERDKFRTRVERTAAGATEIYVTHRGMIEKSVGNNAERGTVWEARPADPELETEFLRRLLVRLGAPQDQARAINAPAARTAARVAAVNNLPVVQLDEGFDRAWRRLGVALDRTGFTVEDRDRTKGTYFVRYVDPSIERKEPGFFSRLMGSSSPDIPTLKYRIVLVSQGEASTVSIQNVQGTADASANAQRMLRVLADELK